MMVKKTKIGIKIIKKTGRVLIWLFGIILLLGIGAFFALKSPAAQTWMAQRAAGYLSDELKTKVTIRAVEIEFFKKVNLEGIYVEDLHGDTLLFADKLQVDIKTFSYANHYISIKSVNLFDSKIKLKKYKNEHGLSYRFIENYFKSTDTTKKEASPWKVEVGGVSLKNVTFAFIDTRDSINDPGMDYENIHVTGINALFTDIDPMGDSLSFRIKGLQGVERCGLALKEFNTRMTVADTFARMDNLHFITPGSAVDGFISFYFNSTEDIADDFIHMVKMDGHFSNSIIEMGDIAYFSPGLLGIKKKVMLTGDIKGTIEHLKCKNVDLLFGEKSHIAGNFSFNGLPNMEETDMNFKIREALTNKKDLEGIPISPFGRGDHLLVDENIGKLGDMTFAGSFEGFLNDFVAHGKFNSALGSLALQNLSMSRNSDSSEYSYVGGIRANHFNVGHFYGIPEMSFVSGDMNIEGSGLANTSIKASLDGSFSELVYHGYSYSGITVSNGDLRRQVFDGDFAIDDPNLKMIFNGIVDNSTALPVFIFDANIKSANLGELNFLDKENEYLLSTDLHMNFKGNNIDNLDGQIVVSNLRYSKNGGKYSFNEFSLNAGNYPDGTRTIFLESDVVRATLKGKFKLLEMPNAVSNLMSNYLPSYFPRSNSKQAKNEPIQEFNWIITFQKNTKPVQALFPKLEIAPFTNFNGKFDSKKEILSTSFSSSSIIYKDIAYNGISLNIENTQTPGTCSLAGTMSQIKVTDTIGINNLLIAVKAKNDFLQTNLAWDNKSKKQNDGDIAGMIHFESPKSFKMIVDSAHFHLNDSLWIVAPQNYFRVDSSRITFHNLVFYSGDASVGLNGFISPKPTDQLIINLKKFNIAYLNYFTVPKGITLSGTVSSETGLADLLETPIFTSNTEFKQFYINGQKLGDGELDAVWEKSKQAVYLHGHFTKGVKNESTGLFIDNILFDGFYYPKNKENSLDVNATFVNIPLDVLQPLLKDFCSVMVGQIDGGLHITGTPAKPKLNGKMFVNFRMVKVDYLGLSLRAPVQPVDIEENSFSFDDFKVTDEYGDTAKIYGHLFHENFEKFQFDMDFGFNHFLVLNTTQKQNESYYGRVFATGYMNIFGYVDDIVRIDMSAKTEKIIRGGQPLYSEFNLPMTSTSEVGSNDFISFVDKTKIDTLKKTKKLKNNGIELHMNMQATPDIIVKVIFDKTVGDELTAYGNGNIKMDITPTGDFTIFGQYEVTKGNYLFTMKNIVLVPFDLAKGGMISWNGDPYNAQIHADAVYKTNTSVEPFFPMDSVNQAYHRSYPVDVVMHLDNNLMNPDVSFDINLPTADQNIQETVKSYTQTDLEKNKQVLSLMVLNSFMTPSELRDGESGNPNYANAGSTLLSNFVSGTLNNWLGQISTDFNMGVKYRPNDDLTTPDLKVFLGTQLLNNRITIDGNVGKVNSNAATGANGQWVGDVNVEYKVTDDGKVRLRAFNRSNDNTVLITNAAYTQGVGVFYREEFESGKVLADRFKKYFFTSSKKTKPVPSPPPAKKPAADSTSTGK